MDDGIYGQGEIIETNVTFDQGVKKEGEVKIELNFAAEDYVRLGYASYQSGDGTDTFVFTYEVATEDYDVDGLSVYIGGDSSGFAGTGTIRAKGTDVELDSTHSGLRNAAGHAVNGGSLHHDRSSPRIISVGFFTDPGDDGVYAAGEQVAVAVAFN